MPAVTHSHAQRPASRRKTRLREITIPKILRQPRSWITLAAILLAVSGGFYFNYRYGWLEQVHLHIASYHWLIVFLLIATLPIFGFSVVICYLVAGSKFGPVWGVAVVALATAVHLLGSHWISTSFLRQRIVAFLARKKYKLPHVPEGENASISLMTAIVPGLPYFARNYLLALAGIPLKTYFWVCLPIYVIRSVLTISASGFSVAFTSKKLLILTLIFFVKVGICVYIVKRLRDKSARATRPIQSQ